MKFLRNKLIVVIIALAAIGLVANNIILPLFPTTIPLSHVEGDEEIDPQEGGFFQQFEDSTEKPGPMADLEKIGWVLDYARDPFKIRTLLDAEVESVVEEKAPVALGEVAPPLSPHDVLFAIVHEPGKSIAVINDVIVSEGDDYGNFKVITIGEDFVELEGRLGNKTLEF